MVFEVLSFECVMDVKDHEASVNIYKWIFSCKANRIPKFFMQNLQLAEFNDILNI